MSQLLVAVDEHDHARQIVDFALSLAKPLSAKILLVYVVPEKPVPDKYKDMHGDSLPEHYYQDLYDRAVGNLAKIITDAKIDFEGVQGVGNPADFIIKTAKSRRVNFIVVGVHGFHGVGRLKAIGNVARNVIERSDIPVFTVP